MQGKHQEVWTRFNGNCKSLWIKVCQRALVKVRRNDGQCCDIDSTLCFCGGLLEKVYGVGNFQSHITLRKPLDKNAKPKMEWPAKMMKSMHGIGSYVQTLQWRQFSKS